MMATALQAQIGQKIAVSEWFEITQERIQAFADISLDRQWIHTDLERAKTDSPFRSTIAQGYLLLSLLPTLSQNIDLFNNKIDMALNYEVNKVRFITPVRPNSYIRNHIILSDVKTPRRRRLHLHMQHRLEIKDYDQPALRAETVTVVLLS